MNKIYLTILSVILLPVLLQAQGRYAVSLSTGAFLPVSSLNNYYNPSYGFEASFSFSANSALNLSVNTGFINFAFDNNAFSGDYAADNPNSAVNLEAPLNIIPLTLGVKYLIGNSRKWKPYISLNAGLYFHIQKISGSITESDGTVTEINQTDKDNDTVLKFGLGLMRKLSRHWFLDFAAKYNLLSNNKSINTDETGKVDTSPITANFVSITGGVQYYF